MLEQQLTEMDNGGFNLSAGFIRSWTSLNALSATPECSPTRHSRS
jgi:hypothetical protein